MADVPAPPPRVHVIVPARSSRAVVLRRGPTDWVQQLVWDLANDEVVAGQWLHAHVFPDRCDVSPDGTLLVAFVRRSRGGAPDAAASAWLALSRPPWFTALALWWWDSTWASGGFFAADGGVHGLPGPPDEGSVPAWLGTATLPVPQPGPHWTDRTVRVNRLLRDGWARTDELGAETWSLGLADGRRLLRDDRPGEAPTWAVAGDGDDRAVHAVVEVLDGCTWAGAHDGRLVAAIDGRLVRWTGDDWQVVADLCDATPDPRPSPPEARAWPPGPPRRDG